MHDAAKKYRVHAQYLSSALFETGIEPAGQTMIKGRVVKLYREEDCVRAILDYYAVRRSAHALRADEIWRKMEEIRRTWEGER
jgi:hypothetical protein